MGESGDGLGLGGQRAGACHRVATGGRDVPRGGSDDAGALTCCVSAPWRAKPREAPPVQFSHK